MHATGLLAGQVRNLRPVPIPSMQLSSFDRYLPCNSHHVREPEHQQIHIQRRPRVHIQTSNPGRYATFLNNNRRGSNVLTDTPSFTAASQLSTGNATSSSTQWGNLNDTDLDTSIPIFGSNQVQLQVRDLVNVSPTPSTLNRIRIDLRNYIVSTLCLGPTPTDENITRV